jgi:ABC-2 type transport system permease protein
LPEAAPAPILLDDVVLSYGSHRVLDRLSLTVPAASVYALRTGLEQRDAAARTLGWVLPSVGVQAIVARIAQTELAAQLAYQDRIRAYHARLREFYYGYLFTDRPFGRADFAAAPRCGP